LANTENSVIANNLFVTAGTGSGQATAVYLGQYRNVLIANNSIRTNSTTGHGIDLSSCSNITATNNDIRVFGIYGIAFRARNSANVFANTNYFYSYQSTNIGLTNTTTTYFTGITPNGITINFVTPATNPASFNYLNLTSGSFVNMTTNSTANVTFQSFSWNNESVRFNFGFPTTSTNVYWFFGGMKPIEYYEYKRNAVVWAVNQTDSNGLLAANYTSGSTFDTIYFTYKKINLDILSPVNYSANLLNPNMTFRPSGSYSSYNCSWLWNGFMQSPVFSVANNSIFDSHMFGFQNTGSNLTQNVSVNCIGQPSHSVQNTSFYNVSVSFYIANCTIVTNVTNVTVNVTSVADNASVYLLKLKKQRIPVFCLPFFDWCLYQWWTAA
jgi:hypothetical protein